MEYYPEIVDCIGNYSFKKLAKALTSQYQKVKQALYYVPVILLYENLDLIRGVLQTSEKSDDLIKLANALEVLAKRSFEQHVINCDIKRTDFSLVGAA